MSVRLCFQEAYRLQVSWKGSDWKFNQSLFPVSKSHWTLLCCPFGHGFVIFFFSSLSLQSGSAPLYSSGIPCPQMPVFQEGSWIILCLYHWWETVLSRIVASQLWSENTGAGFPHLSSVLVFLDHLLLLRLCIAWYWLWVLSLCTRLFQTDIWCCPFLTYRRRFAHWISKTNPFQFLEWLSQYISGMSIVPFFLKSLFRIFFWDAKTIKRMSKVY